MITKCKQSATKLFCFTILVMLIACDKEEIISTERLPEPAQEFIQKYFSNNNILQVKYEKDGRELPIVGLPGCVMYAKRTVFDLVLPRLMADDMVTSDDLAGLGLGGLCLSCDVCTFPNCGFGKGV